MCCTKTISITVLRFYDFVRLLIVISFQITFSGLSECSLSKSFIKLCTCSVFMAFDNSAIAAHRFSFAPSFLALF